MHRVLVAGLMLAACSGGEAGDARPAPTATRDFALRDFTAVALSGADRIDVRRGATFAVRAEGDRASLDRLTIDVADGRLRIGRKRDGWTFGDRTPPAVVHVTMPAIRGAILTGSGDIAIDRADDLDATLTGSGDITIGALHGGTARLAVAGSGTIAAAGRVERLALTVTGSGTIDARQVKAAEAEVAITGSGDAVADVAGPARVRLTGSGSATLGSGAHCTVKRTGSGRANCGA